MVNGCCRAVTFRCVINSPDRVGHDLERLFTTDFSPESSGFPAATVWRGQGAPPALGLAQTVRMVYFSVRGSPLFIQFFSAYFLFP